MIRRLTLRDWRNYEDVTVEFGPGTTFVVASNGVGKTSLVEAARWALFGMNAQGGHAAVRAGAASAVAIVELELPDLRVLTVERTLAGKPRSGARPPTVHLDGASKTVEELDQYLISAYGTESGFLAGLTMPAVDQNHDRPSALGLEDHLGRYYGIDGLRNAAEQLKTLRKSNDAHIKQIKDANSISAQRLDQLRSNVEQAAHQIEQVTQRHQALQARISTAQEQERFRADLKQWQDNHSARTAAIENLAARISADLDQPLAADNLENVLDERLADLDQQIETARVEIAINKTKEATLTANEERLDTAHGDCPVCRRPLDDMTVASAHEANVHELSTARQAILDLRMAENNLLAQRERIKAVQSEWRKIPEIGQSPQPPTNTDDESVSTDLLTAMAEAALSALVEARAAHLQATRELAEAHNADNAMRELESLFRREASLRVAIETTESTLTELLDETIRPLAVEVDQRWRALFPDRGDLTTFSDGTITRTVNGHPLPYDSFSTGESMGATILLRLLVAQMATTADFCWFDEPLEHLDPDVRRKVASLLSRVTGGEGPLKQIVVTTYEEPLARHLQARDKDRVTLLDVRQAG
jgi:DNA repair exonuclease SbcCD ATPase subunit